MGISRNITPRKKAMEDSEKQHLLFQQLFKNLPVGIVFLDGQKTIQDINGIFSRMFGYSLDINSSDEATSISIEFEMQD